MLNKRSILKKCIFLWLLLVCLFCPYIKTFAAESESSFWVEYVDVGQGDCAIVQCDGHYMMIDGGPVKASSVVYTILKNKGINNIDLMIATHPDADHIGGLSGALNYAKAGIVLSPVKSHSTKTFASLDKYVKKQGLDFTMPYYGDTYELGSADVEILGPIYDNVESNNLSIIVNVTYGDISFLFMGDAEEEEESDVIRRYKDLECDVLKVGHHGSKSSTSNTLLKAVNPKYAVISVGSDNSYGHPTQEVLDKLSKCNAEIYRTDLHGDITITSDGKELTVSTEKNASSKDVASGKGNKSNGAFASGNDVTIPSSTTYVLNTNSKKFHKPDCDSVSKMSAKNMKFSTDTAADVIAAGFVACKICRPDAGFAVSDPKKENVTQPAPVEQPVMEQPVVVEPIVPVAPPEPVAVGSAYVLNKNTKKFHYPSCSSVGDMSPKNRLDVVLSRDEIIGQGYVPCKRCNP